MYDYERVQLADEIIAGDVLLKDLSNKQLKELKEDWSMEFEPPQDLFFDIMEEMDRRERKIKAKINHNFFGDKK